MEQKYAFLKRAQIGRGAAQPWRMGVCIQAVGLKRFKGGFCEEVLENGYYQYSLKMVLFSLKLGLKGGLTGHKLALKKRAIFARKGQKSVMKKLEPAKYTKHTKNNGGVNDL